MWPLFWIAVLLFGGIALFSDSGEMTIKPTDNSNCDEEFLKFDENLNIQDSKKKVLSKVRTGLQTAIRDYWAGNNKVKLKGFYIQGSHKHETMIRKPNDTCDVDVGVYFDGKPEISPITIRNNIADLFENRTDEKPEKKNKCVRVHYANQFHVDFPIYYFDPKTGEYFLGVAQTNSWEPSDPKKFTEWFKQNISSHGQKRRLIKYFKSWAATYKKRTGRVMPSGLAFTILVHNNFKEDQREDVAFITTAYNIYKKSKDLAKEDWICKMPVLPEDNVISKLDIDQRGYFLEALEELINSAEKIFKMDSKAECIVGWKYLLGKWFPDELKKNGD